MASKRRRSIRRDRDHWGAVPSKISSADFGQLLQKWHSQSSWRGYNINQNQLLLRGLVMKKSLIAGVSVGAFFAGSALAADMPVKAPLIMKAPPMVYNWTGCYLNAGVGYGMWNQDHSETDGVSGNTVIENTGGGRGWLGRFGGGCDLQLSGTFSNFVIGAFGDYDVMNLNGSMSPLFVSGVSLNPLVANEKESSAGSVGARVGYLLTPTILSYVDGGWTRTRFDQMNETDNFGVADNFGFPAQTYSGWFLGSGFEYNFNWLPLPGLFLRTEYRYSTYSQQDLAEFDTITGVADGNVLHSKKQVQTVTTSVVWRFNWMH